jgi:polar amino acid transport system substrate-binding protein
MRARLVLPALGAAAALLLTGCVDNSTPAPDSNGAASSVSADDAAVALLPADVAESGVLSIGTDAAYPPNEYKDSAGAPIGWGIDLATAIAGKLGLDPEFQISKFDNIIPSIVGEKINIGESSFTVNPARIEQVDFVNYYEAGIQWASATGTDVDPNNACGLRVAVQATTVQDTDEVPAKSDACVAAGLEPIEKLQFDTQDLATNAVVLGQADALSADSPVTFYAISQNDGDLQAAGETFDVTPYGIALAKGNGMAGAVQAALQSLVDDGTYENILNEWGVADGGISTITINELAVG